MAAKKHDLLLVTGPISNQQLHPEKVIWQRPCSLVNLQGAGSHDYHYAAAIETWLSGQKFRDRLIAKSMLPADAIGRVGILWFSAGHGAARRLVELQGPGAADYWLCLDGLYAGWKAAAPWAMSVAKAAIEGETVLIGTASSSTPGQYADGISAWANVFEALEVTTGTEIAGFPPADPVWRKGSACVMGYREIGHGQQAPKLSRPLCEAFSRRWSGSGLGALMANIWASAWGKGLLVAVVGGIGAVLVAREASRG